MDSASFFTPFMHTVRMQHRVMLKQAIETHAYVRSQDATIIARKTKSAHRNGWLFDLRTILLQPDVMENIAALFWEKYGQASDVQICGIESAGIPLIAGLVNVGYGTYGKDKVTG